MNNFTAKFSAMVIGLFLLGMALPVLAAPPKATSLPPKTDDQIEAEAIGALAATNSDRTITSAMTLLERLHSKDLSHTNAIPALKSLLADNRSPVRRKAARILGIFHAPMSAADLQAVCTQLKAEDWGEVQSGLKALRGLDAAEMVPEILPCLKHTNANVVRDACRTLAVVGDKSVIPAIEPLLASDNSKIKKDAEDAIQLLKSKP
jgi:hypothetical protein